jgi:putative ABC transport system permease protein
MILGITLGVAVAVAIDLANASASRAFDLSTEAITGRATHQIIAGPEGLDDTLYKRVRVEAGIDAAAPVISAYVSSQQLGDIPLQLLGVDPFAETPFRDYLQVGRGEGSVTTLDLTAFLTQPGAILISKDLAEKYGLSTCSGLPVSTKEPVPQNCQVTLVISGHEENVFIAGLLEPSGQNRTETSLSQRALENMILTDIATAQELIGRLGQLDRIDLILTEAGSGGESQEALLQKIRAILPTGVRVEPVEARSNAIAQMTAAFRLNLTALSLLAMVVGMFLIYNTMTFSVVQRRPHFGTLRCLGVTRREVFALVIGEAFIVGAVGAAFGIVLGILMGQGAVRMVTQTINDLYFTLSVRGVQIPASSLIKGALLGIFATLLSAAPPAWEAASVPPREALSRSGLESKAQKVVNLAAIGGVALLFSGALLLYLQTKDLVISFSGTFLVIVGFAMLAPLTTRVLIRAASLLFSRIWGTLGRMAPRDVIKALSRTSVAIAALMVAVSVTIGVSLMVTSFRHTVVAWLEETLQGDIYISVPGLAANQSSGIIDPRAISTVKGWPGVQRVDVLRSAAVDSPEGPVHIAATDNPTLVDERIFLSASGDPVALASALENGAVLVSEPFTNQYNISRPGDQVTLYTDNGPHAFTVAGIYYDYASSQGTILMTLSNYRSWWHDDALTAMSLRLSPGADVNLVATDLQQAVAPVQQLLVRPNRALREDVLVVFDRTFAITRALQILAMVVAFIGVLSALLSLQLERQHELGILRAIGLTARQLWALIMVETGLMGTVAGLLSMPTGFVLAWILVYIINRRSFGWTLQMQVHATPFLQALAVAVIAALLAGVYPARKIGEMAAAEALRSE